SAEPAVTGEPGDIAPDRHLRHGEAPRELGDGAVALIHDELHDPVPPLGSRRVPECVGDGHVPLNKLCPVPDTMPCPMLGDGPPSTAAVACSTARRPQRYRG